MTWLDLALVTCSQIAAKNKLHFISRKKQKKTIKCSFNLFFRIIIKRRKTFTSLPSHVVVMMAMEQL